MTNEVRLDPHSYSLTQILTVPLVISCVVVGGCPAEPEFPHMVRSMLAEDAAYNCDVLALSSDWECTAEERVIPLSCGWLDTNRFGKVIDEGSTGCVTMTCDRVLERAEWECHNRLEGEFVLGDSSSGECCTADDCGTEFGCY